MANLNKGEKYLLEMIKRVDEEGFLDENPRPVYESDGTPAHSIAISQMVMEYDISKGEFPITETRNIAWKSGIQEIRAFYQEQTNDLDVMRDKYGIKWWDLWRVEGTNHHGQRYGHTVNRYKLIDKLLDGLVNDPFGRRHILNLWQEQEFEEDADSLKPCAFLSMYTVRKCKGKLYLDATLVQRFY